jgi:hypothetical protein
MGIIMEFRTGLPKTLAGSSWDNVSIFKGLDTQKYPTNLERSTFCFLFKLPRVCYQNNTQALATS